MGRQSRLLQSIPSGRSCIIECDLEYDDETKLRTMKFPLAPEKKVVDVNDLSTHQRLMQYSKEEFARFIVEQASNSSTPKEKKLEIYQRFCKTCTRQQLLKYIYNQKGGLKFTKDTLLTALSPKVPKTEKLICDMKDKKNYIIHHRILKYYMSLGLKVSKVHRVISFKEEAWLAPYIKFNTDMRTAAETTFEKNMFKLMNNAFYGKTCENIRNRANIELVTDSKRAIKLQSQSNYKGQTIYDENLTVIHMNIKKVKFNKPIYVGMAVLDLSKLLMYQTYYDVINKRWPNNEIIGFDTDSFFLNIHTEDLYKDMEDIREYLDTSEYPKGHPLTLGETNKKVLGKFKDELNGKVMREIILLRAKQYSYLVEEKEVNKIKGVARAVVAKEITMNDFKTTLYGNEIKYSKMNVLNAIKLEMYRIEINKKSLGAYDDKKKIGSDGITTLPFGCESIMNTLPEHIQNLFTTHPFGSSPMNSVIAVSA